MSLLARSVLGVAVTVTAVLAVSYWLLAATILSETRRLNQQLAVDSVKRSALALEGMAREMKALVIDYAAWDDTYDYFSSRASHYITSNFVTELYTNLDVDMALLLQPDGRLVYGSMLGSDGKITTRLTPSVLAQVQGDRRFTAGREIEDARSGFTLLDGQLAVVSLSPVLDSSNEGPAVGSMIFIRWLNRTRLGGLQDSADAEFRLLPTAAIEPDEPCACVLDGRAADSHCLQTGTGGTILACRRFMDLFDYPSFVLRTETPPQLMPSAARFELLLGVIMLCAGMALGAFIYLALTKRVLNPIRRLCREVTGTDPLLLARGKITPIPDPELSLLSSSMQSMAERVADTYLELSSQQEAYAQLLELAHEGICSVDRHETITKVNDAFCLLLGYSSAELVGRSVLDLVHPDERTLALAGTKQRAAGVSAKYELRLLTKAGDWIDCLVSASPMFDCKGEYSGTLAGIVDLTQLRRNQQLLVNAQKLESVGLLAGGIAHDFNNLLVGIMGNAHLALEEDVSHGPAREAVKQILAASEQAARLTRQLLAYAGKGQLQQSSICLRELLDEVAAVMRAALPKNVTLDLPRGAGQFPVRGDEVQLKQTFMNIILNAAEAYEGAPGRVRIAIKRAKLEDRDLRTEYVEHTPPSGEYAVVEVADQGRGMNQQVLSQLFDPFFTTKAQGRGLGMSAVLGIVIRHGGTIQVDSQPGRGSTFRVMLPLSDVLDAPGGPGTGASPAGQVGRVLVVDDEQVVRNVAKAMLTRLGNQVELAADGSEALAILESRSGEYDSMLLDMSMPGLETAAILERVRQLAPELRVVLMSGFTNADVSADYDAYSISAFLAKPFSPEDLAGALANAADHSPAHAAGQSRG